MNNNKYRILAVEDDKSVSGLLLTLLDAQQYETLLAENCAQGLMMLRSHVPDLIILDLGLPDRDGLEFIREARQENAAPILVLSARSTERDKVTALDLGANDYITKPFSAAEFLARVRSVLRFSRHGADAGRLSQGRYQVQDLTIEYDSRRVFVGDTEVKLTQTEFNILAFLSEYSGKVMTYPAIIKAIWGYSTEGGVKRLQVNMANIRKKLGIQPGKNNYIINELGVGYRMNTDER